MQDKIEFIDRETGKPEEERVYGGAILNYMYGGSLLGNLLQKVTAKFPAYSSLYGIAMRMPWTKRLIGPFVEKYGIDSSEFEKPLQGFSSFNDFFIRHLKSSARPIDADPYSAVIPADGRYYFYPNIAECDGFVVKGKKFSLDRLLQNKDLAAKYAHGSLVMARLCPIDYHRFHFPIDNVPNTPRLINGPLYSVNPVAIKKNIEIFTENKRMITLLDSEEFGSVLFIEVGATSVGSIIHTAKPGIFYTKGKEKGYFSFGASSLILLFEPGRISFENDLIELSRKGLEIRCLMGQRMGSARRS